MHSLSPFTPLSYPGEESSWADRYLALSSKKAVVVTADGNRRDIRFSSSEVSWGEAALKVISFIPVIFLLIALSIQAYERMNCKFYLSGCDVSEEMMQQLELLQESIVNGTNHPQIEWLSKGNNLVFSLRGNPSVVFKTQSPYKQVKINGVGSTPRRFVNYRLTQLEKARNFCCRNGLDRLIVPNGCLVEIAGRNGKAIPFVAEERYEIEGAQGVQESLYYEWREELDEPAAQLAKLISKMGFSDVEPRNIPLLRDPITGQVKILLVDLEHFEGPEIGIFGSGKDKRGLIRCLFQPSQIDVALKEARKRKIRPGSGTLQDVRAQRIAEIGLEEARRQVYEARGILADPLLPIAIEDEDGLGLSDLDVERGEQRVTLRAALRYTVAQLNRSLQALAKSRKPHLSDRFCRIANVPPEYAFHKSGRPFSYYNDDPKESWMGCILEALQRAKYIFRVDCVGGSYLIKF